MHNIQDIIEFASTKPMISNNKVVILFQANQFSNNVANSLLKTLEDPKTYSIFLTSRTRQCIQ